MMDELLESVELGAASPSEFASRVFASAAAPAAAARELDERTKQLERALRSEVCANSDELLRNAADIAYMRERGAALKAQIARARRDVDAVAASIADPFAAVVANARTLSENAQRCRRLRLLLAFVARARQAPDAIPAGKIAGVRSDAKRLCELARIAQTGELDGIEVFRALWAAKRPACEALLRTADAQLRAALERGDAADAANAACVLAHAGTLPETARALHARAAGALRVDAGAIERAPVGGAMAAVQRALRAADAAVQRIDALRECCEAALRKSPDAVLPAFADGLRADAAVAEFARALAGALSRRAQAGAAAEVAECAARARSSAHCAAVADALAPLQDAFVRASLQEMRKAFFRSFSQSESGDGGAVARCCAAMQSRLEGFGPELRMCFRPAVLQIANDFVKMNRHENAALQRQAEMQRDAVKTGLTAIMKKLFGEEAETEVLSILS